MKIPRGHAVAGLLLVLAVAACGSGAPAVTSSQNAPSPSAVTFEDSQAALCAAFTSLIRAVGNPDAGTPSVMSKALDDAVAAADPVAADRAAATMLSELEVGRQHAATAGRWQPASFTMVQMDRLLLAFSAMVRAKQAVAAKAPGAIDPQIAFEKAGGVEAWSGLLQGMGAMAVPAGASPAPCKAFSGTI